MSRVPLTIKRIYCVLMLVDETNYVCQERSKWKDLCLQRSETIQHYMIELLVMTKIRHSKMILSFKSLCQNHHFHLRVINTDRKNPETFTLPFFRKISRVMYLGRQVKEPFYIFYYGVSFILQQGKWLLGSLRNVNIYWFVVVLGM